jgi:NADPH-dependent 7-cyano-7-deazaguanine reductase QueF-like protein
MNQKNSIDNVARDDVSINSKLKKIVETKSLKNVLISMFNDKNESDAIVD